MSTDMLPPGTSGTYCERYTAPSSCLLQGSRYPCNPCMHRAQQQRQDLQRQKEREAAMTTEQINTEQAEPQRDRSLEDVIRDLRMAEADWAPKRRASLQAHAELQRLSAVALKAQEEVAKYKEEAQKMIKRIGT